MANLVRYSFHHVGGSITVNLAGCERRERRLKYLARWSSRGIGIGIRFDKGFVSFKVVEVCFFLDSGRVELFGHSSIRSIHTE